MVTPSGVDDRSLRKLDRSPAEQSAPKSVNCGGTSFAFSKLKFESEAVDGSNGRTSRQTMPSVEATSANKKRQVVQDDVLTE